jgi:hypothetical protein
MSGTKIDRLNGVTDGLAIKAPCRVATTANITLSGLQTIDGVALAANDRVLVKDQTTTSENGIYAASTGPWTRSTDFDGGGDIVEGTLVFITSGTSASETLWRVSTPSPAVGSALAFSNSSLTTIFLQDGTGATSRTVHSKLKDSVSISDFGAVGDGTTNDTTAIQNAIAYGQSSGNEVFFPPGTYLVTSQITVHRQSVRGARATLKFSGLGASTDCLVLQGSSRSEQLVWSGINVDANSTGRDAIVLSGGTVSSTSADYLRLQDVHITGAVRDGIHIEPATNNCWIEDFIARDVRITSPGRNGIFVKIPNYTAAFLNQSAFHNVEIRGAALTTAGYDVYMEYAGSASDQKISELLFQDCEFDADGGTNHGQASFYLVKTGSAGSIDGLTFISCTFEDVSGTIITGFPPCLVVAAGTTVGSVTQVGGIIVGYGYLVDYDTFASQVFSRSQGGDRDLHSISLSAIGFAASYANDAAAAAAGVPIGGLYRNGSAVSIRVT